MTPEPKDSMRLKSEAERDSGRSSLLDAAPPIFLRESEATATTETINKDKACLTVAVPEASVINEPVIKEPVLKEPVIKEPVLTELAYELPLEPEAKERLVVQPTERKRQHLINIIANPNTKESEWLKACEILRDWNPLWSRQKTYRKNITTILLSGATTCAGLFAIALMPQPMSSLNTPWVKWEQKGTIQGQDFPTYLTYMSQMKDKIQGAWSPPSSREVNKVGVRYTVFKDGRVDGLAITRSSGNQTADAAVLDAVKKASPFDRLPNSTNESAEINLILGAKAD